MQSNKDALNHTAFTRRRSANWRSSAVQTGFFVAMLAFAVGQNLSTPACADDFFDDFEGNEINAYWTVFETSGTATLSSDRVHGGNQSLQVETVNSDKNKGVQLQHEFDEPVYGTASIWVYDSGADHSSSNYLSFYLLNYDDTSHYPYISTWDYDLGKGHGGDYQYGTWSGYGTSNIDRTEAWHYWEITSRPDQLSVVVDGTKIASASSGKPFDVVVFTMFAPSWRPAWVAQFDDFAFHEYRMVMGDLNCDDAVDFNDIDPFVLALIHESDYSSQYPGCDISRADMNGDGFVDFSDIDGFVTCLINGGCN